MTRDVYNQAMIILDQLNETVDKAINQLNNEIEKDGYGFGKEGWDLSFFIN